MRIILAFIFIFQTGSIWADMRHIYNCSDVDVTVGLGLGTDASIFMPVTVNAHMTVPYNTSGVYVIKITGFYGEFYTSPFGPYIEHQGSTGSITLNDPADGDIKFGNCK